METNIRSKRTPLICKCSLIKQQGISLIELLLVIVLVGCMAVWAAPNWHHYRQRERLADSARQLLGFLTHLQAQTNRNNRTALLWAQPHGQGCLGSGDKPVAPCSAQTGTVFIPPYSDIAISISMQKEIGFYGVRNTAQAGNILLSNPAGRIHLVISGRGRMRLCSEGQSLSGIHLC
ncbi:prepilin peptidase-dependent protein [Yersinia pekkanenii]|uniref:Prepilin peptidase dependent protein Aprecursor n=1 Tax=Yersinia pekkanenii TaxID=1288385 RepID=A0A0T9P8C9_9GAMM|nr:prepilin peptidase-dependent protein [Yersinia pekkanenii]CNH51121.1 Prepilin peptidase dependent protein Aprecursor [Yersinia pekkanenii]CRY67858.1 Prepilin peptidase dependent protein Aprecursor [Yersinia pekkanenii]